MSHPEIFENYKDIKRVNDIPGHDISDDRYNTIKQYAIDHTKFYNNYKVEDRFPVMAKLDIIEKQDFILSDELFSLPFYISSISGSTGIPFKVEQNKEKRDRNIADLKVYDEYALFKSHEKMIILDSITCSRYIL